MLAAETSGRYWGGLKLKGWDSTLPVWAGASLLLVLLMAFPLGAIFSTSVRNQAGLTFGNYAEVFTKPAFLTAIRNTIVISFWVGLIAVIVGGLLGWLVTRTDLPWKKTSFSSIFLR